ncbi:hypothetical protein LOK49_LG01G00694 [Camellia lanceoleosa]|uniref:Uncharacterized protein n=1 Tax=Camellia lanceoleosa TaxID=1840588 RepID=A0ACC0J0C2_9ERIC|nr:hypothetical protein LOK49_LG01G00694 [Camellia lanceoleosa]
MEVEMVVALSNGVRSSLARSGAMDVDLSLATSEDDRAIQGSSQVRFVINPSFEPTNSVWKCEHLISTAQTFEAESIRGSEEVNMMKSEQETKKLGLKKDLIFLILQFSMRRSSGRFLIWLAKRNLDSKNYLGLEIRKKVWGHIPWLSNPIENSSD